MRTVNMNLQINKKCSHCQFYGDYTDGEHCFLHARSTRYYRRCKGFIWKDKILQQNRKVEQK